MRRFSDRPTLSTLSELNVTPLLDLAFVLLIIFMITTPLMENSVDLTLPSSQAAAGAVDPDDVRIISINRDEAIEFNGEPVTAEALDTRLAALREGGPNTAVVVRAHRDLPVQTLVTMMDRLQRAKITKVGVVTNPEE